MFEFERKKSEILSRIDVVDLVSEHMTLKRSGRRWIGLCPFHEEKTPSFTVSPDRGSFKCFGCGKGGDVFTFVQFRENVPFMEAMRMLADRAGVTLDTQPPQARRETGRAEMIRVNAWAVEVFRRRLLDASLGKTARDYVRGRKIADEIAERFQLGLAGGGSNELITAARKEGLDADLLEAADLIRRGDEGRSYDTFRDRLMFPIRDATGRVIGFGGRTLVDDRAKYLNTRQNALFDKGRNLYGLDQARDAATSAGRFVVVEGYTDCLACHQAGFTNAVATLGTAMTDAQVALMRRYAEEVVLLFDSDEAGDAAAERAVRVALPQCVTVKLARLPDGKDPGEFFETHEPSEFSDVLNAAVDALEFSWRNTLRRYQGEHSDGRRREAVADFLRIVAEGVDAQAVDAIQRGLLVNQVAHLLRMPREEVDHLMRRLRPRGGRPGGSTREHDGPLHRGANREPSAWTMLLEVLLNEPGLLSAAGAFPDVSQIVDPRDRRIGEAVLALVEELGEFRLADVLARFHDAEDVNRIISLAERGAGRGNYARTFEVAMEKLSRARRDHAVITGDEFGVRDVAARSAFVPRRLARRMVAPAGAATKAGPPQTMENT